MLDTYPAIFFKEKKGYSVSFPDLNYLATQGDSLDNAMEMAVDCLAGYLYCCRNDGDVIPAPSLPNEINPVEYARELGFESDDSFVSLVSVDVNAYAKAHFNKSVRRSVTIPQWINDAARQRNINFSKTLQEALLSKMQAT